jgi:hypothetical protein
MARGQCLLSILMAAARLGLGADPAYWQELESVVETIEDLPEPTDSIADPALQPILELVVDPNVTAASFSATTYGEEGLRNRSIAIETISRATLLRECAETIATAINTAIVTNRVKPNEIAIIAPGLDNIAEYALREILSKKNIPFMPLNPQKPIINNPQVRSLLTLLTLVYPNLGRLVNRDQVAEMLVVLSQVFNRTFNRGLVDRINSLSPYSFNQDSQNQTISEQNTPVAVVSATEQSLTQATESEQSRRSPLPRCKLSQPRSIRCALVFLLIIALCPTPINPNS